MHIYIYTYKLSNPNPTSHVPNLQAPGPFPLQRAQCHWRAAAFGSSAGRGECWFHPKKHGHVEPRNHPKSSENDGNGVGWKPVFFTSKDWVCSEYIYILYLKMMETSFRENDWVCSFIWNRVWWPKAWRIRPSTIRGCGSWNAWTCLRTTWATT